MAILVLIAACYEPPDYRRTHFACKKSSLCPTGLVCSEDHCVEPPNDMALVEHEPLFLITRDEAIGLSAAGAAAFCESKQMRLPTDEEWSAAELAGFLRGDGVRCVRGVE